MIAGLFDAYSLLKIGTYKPSSVVGSHDLILMFRYETYFLDKVITFHIIQRFVYCKFIKYTHSGAMLLCYLMIINAKICYEAHFNAFSQRLCRRVCFDKIGCIYKGLWLHIIEYVSHFLHFSRTLHKSRYEISFALCHNYYD